MRYITALLLGLTACGPGDTPPALAPGAKPVYGRCFGHEVRVSDLSPYKHLDDGDRIAVKTMRGWEEYPAQFAGNDLWGCASDIVSR